MGARSSSAYAVDQTPTSGVCSSHRPRSPRGLWSFSVRELRAAQIDADRFWAKVDIGEPDACWPWRRCVTSGGYGNVGLIYSRRSAQAHRAAFALAHGSVPAGAVVRHKCDQPRCCNPAHLELGTQGDNVRDCFARGRGPERRGAANPNYRHGLRVGGV